MESNNKKKVLRNFDDYFELLKNRKPKSMTIEDYKRVAAIRYLESKGIEVDRNFATETIVFKANSINIKQDTNIVDVFASNENIELHKAPKNKSYTTISSGSLRRIEDYFEKEIGIQIWGDLPGSSRLEKLDYYLINTRK